ncbi:MAG: penicillin-binding protein 2 [Clostridiaceae bacterium]|nr:penicillin-binding protein 2 [Clostridiaceae bacterium]
MSRKLKKTQVQYRSSSKKRLLFMGCTASFVISLLVVRLFYIQIIQHDFYTAEINKQREISIPINSGRGIILDRNLIPLTDRSTEGVVVIFPKLFNINEENIKLLQEITNKNYSELMHIFSTSNHAIELTSKVDVDWQEERILNTRGLFIIEKTQRYEERQLLTHVLGYISQIEHIGMAGLEKSLNPILMGNPTRSLAITLDGRKRVLPGEGISIVNTPNTQQNVRLTIDYHIQKIAEEVMDQYNRDGAIVISEIETGEILSIVSRPTYDPNNITMHITSEGDELYNKAVQMTFPPGSIFKIVLAAEALEKEVITLESEFYCDGSQKVGNIEVKCNVHSPEEYGYISLKEAFAKSCNSFFIQLGQKLSAQNIIEMAKSLGLEEKVNIGLLEEEKGVLPSGDHLLGPVIGNISIGQGPIEVTPIQVNQMTQIIGNNGVKKPLYLLKDILKEYEVMEEFEKKDSSVVLSKENSKKLQKIMQEVMTEGTGRNVGELSAITAGKTGTAQASKRGEHILHAWFTGYYPVEQPQYAITIFVQEGGSAGTVAVPIFKEIVERMISIEYLDGE